MKAANKSHLRSFEIKDLESKLISYSKKSGDNYQSMCGESGLYFDVVKVAKFKAEIVRGDGCEKCAKALQEISNKFK